MLWHANGVALCTAVGDQTSPAITADRRGGAIAAWNDGRLGPNTFHVYAQHIDASGSAGGAVGVTPGLPTAFRMLPAIPNPSAGRVTITFELPVGAEISADVVDIVGRHVRTLTTRQFLVAGTHSLAWDARNGAGTRVTAGLYVIRVRAGDLAGLSKVVISR